jgi:hypothetical protein
MYTIDVHLQILGTRRTIYVTPFWLLVPLRTGYVYPSTFCYFGFFFPFSKKKRSLFLVSYFYLVWSCFYHVIYNIIVKVNIPVQ